MRIAFLSQPRDAVAASLAQHGSVVIVLMALARLLVAPDEITVLAPHGAGPAAETTAEGIHIRRAPPQPRTLHRGIDALKGLIGHGLPHSLGRLYFPGYARWAAETLAGEPPDVLHVMSCAQFAPRLRRQLPRTRLVLHLHDASYLRTDARLAVARLGAFDAVVTCSQWLARRLGERLPTLASRIHHVGNGVDTTVFHPAAGQEARSTVRLLHVGRISPEKGVHVLAQAFATLAADHPTLELQLVGTPGLLPLPLLRLTADHAAVIEAMRFYGDGPFSRFRLQVLQAGTSYREALLALIPPPLHQRVLWAGPTSHAALPPLYRDADILVAPSVWEEPFGIPVAEAMASGLPVVATDGGGIPEQVVDGESGILVPRGDTAALTEALGRLIDDAEARRRMGAMARAQAVERLDWNHAAERLRLVFAELGAG